MKSFGKGSIALIGIIVLIILVLALVFWEYIMMVIIEKEKDY